jgi:catechol 2,3-dioxygenase
VVNEQSYGIQPPGYRLPAPARIGQTRLQISDLKRSLSYYRDVLGMRLLHSDSSTAALGAHSERAGSDDTRDDVIIELREKPDIRPVPPGGRLGLFHFAILLPDRAALGRFAGHLAGAGVQFASADHFVSEAIYLWDPDGLGIEVYADRPREEWRVHPAPAPTERAVQSPVGRELVMTTEPLNLRSLLKAAGNETWTGMPAGMTMGHVHLSVSDLSRARAFYHAALGFDVVVWSYPGAVFLSAGGYHHHLGTNVWAAGAPLATDGDARLLEWELVLPAENDVQAAAESMRRAGYEVMPAGPDVIVADPWGVGLRLSWAGKQVGG